MLPHGAAGPEAAGGGAGAAEGGEGGSHPERGVREGSGPAGPGEQGADNIEELRREWQNRRYIDGAEVTENDIAEVVASWTGIPVAKLEESEAQRLLRLEEVLHKRVVGQMRRGGVARAVRRAHAGLKNPRRPVGSFLFLGPTGVGKTELARPSRRRCSAARTP